MVVVHLLRAAVRIVLQIRAFYSATSVCKQLFLFPMNEYIYEWYIYETTVLRQNAEQASVYAEV